MIQSKAYSTRESPGLVVVQVMVASQLAPNVSLELAKTEDTVHTLELLTAVLARKVRRGDHVPVGREPCGVPGFVWAGCGCERKAS